MTDVRPDPDALLAQVTAQAEAARRGRLRIYFGASAGVGKTYAMLTAARALRGEGKDVIVGLLETHGRKETEALLQGLEVLPRAQIAFQDRTLPEFDLDGALARHPALILVDELAHTNVPGARHPKRWQDIDELLAAGIDVYSTLNVQHIESLNDVVGGITGIKVWETVPDFFFDKADEVVMVDVSADDLLGRLAAGKVYSARANRTGRQELLPQGQPDGAARTRAAQDGGPRGGGRPGLPLRQVDRARMEDRRFPVVLHRARPGRRGRGAQRRPVGITTRRGLDRRLCRDADVATAANAGTRADTADRQAGTGVRRPDVRALRWRCGGGDHRVRAHAQLLQAGRRTQARRGELALGARHRAPDRRAGTGHRPDRGRAQYRAAGGDATEPKPR